MFTDISVAQRSVDRACGLHALGLLLLSTSTFAAIALLAISPTAAQTVTPPQQAATDQSNLPPIKVSGKRPKLRGKPKKPHTEAAAPPAPNTAPTPPGSLAGIPMPPLNPVATSASRLGLPVLETPASVDVVTKQTIADQGYRTTTDTAQGAVGVLSGDAAG